ncbi:MAG: glycosyltransferase family 4 protein [Flavobacteriaceae bacterium]
MRKNKLVRITTIPLSLEKLLEGQLAFMSNHFEVIAVSSEKERLERYAKKEGISCFYVKLTRKITPFMDSIAVYKLYQFLKREQPQIVHTHTPKAGIVGMMAAWLANVPIRLHTVAGLPLMEASGIKRLLLVFIERLTYRFATKVYPNSEGLKSFIIQEKLAPVQKLLVIGNGSSNGIDTQYFSSESYDAVFKKNSRKNLGILPQEFVFIFVGRIVKDKGIVELIDAFSAFQDKNIKLLLVGPLEQDLDPLPKATIEKMETNPKIISIGYQDDVRPYLAISDALVFPSYREGFPNVVLQALAMELPSIVSNINGCNEIIKEGFNGRIVPKKDEKALFDAMQQLLENKSLYTTMKNNSRQSILEKYDRIVIWEALVDEYKTFIK